MAFVFSREGPVEELGATEELAEAPEAIEMHVVLWHVARCTGAEDFDGGAGAASGIVREGFEESGRRALLRNLALRALKMKHWSYAQASLPWPS